MTNRAFYENLDTIDPLNPLRSEFHLPPDTIYLDGNSLGIMPLAAPVRAKQVMLQEWGDDLIASWNKADWINLPMRLGNKIAPLVGAGQDEIVVCDSTSLNLYKVLYSAIQIARKRHPARRKIVSEKPISRPIFILLKVCARNLTCRWNWSTTRRSTQSSMMIWLYCCSHT